MVSFSTTRRSGDHRARVAHGGSARSGAHCAGSGRRRRGSVMLLTIGVLTLLVILAIAYMQVARLDRVGTSTVSERNIDIVARATIEQLQQVLKEDLMDSEGNFFNAAPDNAFEPGTAPFDYPWTNPDPNNDRNERPILLADGTEATAYGGHVDSMWLAATMPDFTDVNNPVWPKITNLTGLFLTLPVEAPDNQGVPRQPAENVVDFGATTGGAGNLWARRDHDLRITGQTDADNIPLDSSPAANLWQQIGTDATGDGVEDSRWTWAPIRQIGSTKYIAAYRIIDNSSMVDANTVLSQVDQSGAYDTATMGSDAPRWWYPSELDLGRFVFNHGEMASEWANHPYNNTTQFMPELEQLLDFRLRGDSATGNTNLPVPWGFNPEQRGHFWLNGPALYGNFNDASGGLGSGTDYQRLRITNELALRYRGGLSSPEFHNVTLGNAENDSGNETGMPVLMRTDDPDRDEWHYAHFTGGLDPANPNFQHDTSRLMSYFALNPRGQMTVRSGASIQAGRLGREQPFRLPGAATTTPGRILKADINRRFILPRDGAGLRDAILRVYAPEDANLNRPNDDDWPPGVNTAEEFAAQFAANILDYADNDNLLTRVPMPGAGDDEGDGDAGGDEGDGGITGNDRWGMEALPFAVEFYVQREYQGQIIEEEGEDDTGLPITINHILWTATGPAGYAIEIRNPFRRPILLTDVYLMVDNANWGPLDQMSMANNPFHPFLPADHVLVLYREAQDGAEGGGVAPGNSVREQIEHIDSSTTIAVDLGDVEADEWAPRIWPEVDEEFPIGLHASWAEEGGAAVMLPWPYQRSDRLRGIPAEHLQENAIIPEEIGPDDLIAYRQATTIGNAQRAEPPGGDSLANLQVESLNMITVRPEDFERNDTGPPGLMVVEGENGEGGDVLFGLEHRDDVAQLGIPQFVGDADKTPQADGHVTRAMDADLTLTPAQVLGRNQIVFNGFGAMTHIGELAHIAALGPTPIRTIAEVWHGEADNRGRTAESVDEFLLRFRPPHGLAGPVFNQNYPPPGLLETRAETDPEAYDHLRVPHAVALMDRFTTLSPAEDNVDNDGSGQADQLAADGLPSEQFVPGTINLNTISRDLSSLDLWSAGGIDTPTHLLWHVLPIPDEQVRESVIRAIVNYREVVQGFADNSRNTFITGYRGDDTGIPGVERSSPGIAHLAELMNAIGPNNEEPIGINASGRIDILGDSMDDQRYGGYDAWRMYSPEFGTGNLVPIDFPTNPLFGTQQADFDRIADDRKEKAMIVKWLSQVASVRSDIFTAYVVIRGYPADDFRQGPTEQMRFFVVLDRSRITDRDGRVRVLAVHQY